MSAEPLVLGTAGHVDHGKTALVRALTGRETDRLAEERKRGISIELGFAPLPLPSGRRVSLIDVPGHERFVRHMVAGTTGVDGYLLCVAADDGVMPQTREHLDVLRLLGIGEGVVAVTRSDLADPAPAVAEVAALVDQGVEIVPVCAPRGDGVADLLDAVERLVARLRPRPRGGRPRLFVDRSFSLPGAGTVVTGTLWGGSVARGDRLVVHPAGTPARVRGVHVHDEPVERAGGGRVALALAGPARDEARRGACVVREDDGWTASTRLAVALSWLADPAVTLASGRRLQGFLGTAEVPLTVLLLDAATLEPGDEALAELRLERPVPAARDDRIVLRSSERRTVGGARVIDPHPPRLARGDLAARLRVLDGGSPEDVLRLRLREAGPAGLAPEPRLTALPEAVTLGDRVVHAAEAARAREAVLARLGPEGVAVAEARAAGGLPPAAAAALVDALVREGAAERRGDRVAPPGTARLDPAAETVAAALRQGGLRPPSVHRLGEATGLSPAALRAALGALRTEGRAAPAEDLWFDADALAGAADQARGALARKPLGLAELRDLWGVGRRHAQAIAAHLDATGITARRGDVRVLRGAHRDRA